MVGHLLYELSPSEPNSVFHSYNMSHSAYGHRSADGMATMLLGELNQSFNPSCYEILDDQPGDKTARSWFSFGTVVWMGLWGVVTLFLLLNLKNLPGMWHVSDPTSTTSYNT